MPYVTQWVEPETFLKHNDVTIFHTYDEDESDDINTYWFMASLDGVFEHGAEFDVRHLATWAEHGPDIPVAIKAAIEAGEIKNLIVVPPEDRDLT